jgi:hypothetical protein
MCAKRRRSQKQLPQPQHEGVASLAPAGQMKAGAYAVRASKTRHGPHQSWGKYEYTQAALAVIYRGGDVPKNVDRSNLVARVNAVLADDPEYRATGRGRISRNTVLRAAGLLS